MVFFRSHFASSRFALGGRAVCRQNQRLGPQRPQQRLDCRSVSMKISSMSPGDLAGLAAFGDDASGGKGVDSAQPAKKRICLKHYDLVPAQLLNPMGMSGIERFPLQQLWEHCKKGNKAASYFSELCSDDDARRRVGLSRACEVLEVAIHRLGDCPQTKLVLKEAVLDKALEEAATLLPHLNVLNKGKGEQRSSSSIRSVAYYAPLAAAPAANNLEESVTFLHEWLEKTSILRGLIVFLSSGGVFFSAQCHEKTMRAFLTHGGGDLKAFKRAALARPADVAPSSSDVEGLQ
jgi:hypothetical protein